MRARTQNRPHLFSYVYELTLLLAILVYAIYWSELSIYRIVTFQAAVFDLGSFAQGWYLALHSTPFGIFEWFLNRDPAVIFSPLTSFHSLQLVVVLQTVFLAIPALLIYKISNTVIKSKFPSLIFSIVYLLSPLLYGIQWFDVHNQAFFVFFFLLAFYLFLRKNYILSTAIFLVAGMTHYLYLVFPILFAIPVFFYSLKEKGTSNFKNKETQWSLTILLLSAFFLALSYYLNKGGVASTLSIAHSQGFSASYPRYRLMTLIIAIGPLAFLPLIPNRFSSLMVPFLVLTFISPAYIYPSILRNQYASMVIPGIFVSSIYSYSFLMTKFSDLRMYISDRSKRKRERKRYLTWKRVSDTLYVVMFVLIVYLLLSYAPYGYNNSHTGFYNTSLPEKEYSTLFADFEAVASFIPRNDPYVVFGNGEPELLPRPQLPNAPILETPYGLTYNLTYKDLNDNNYSTPIIQYVIGNPYGNQFTGAEAPPYNLSEFDLLKRLYDSGQYGIVAEASGIVLLEKNYSGQMKLFIPLNLNLSPSYLNASYILGYVPYYGGNNVYKFDGPLEVEKSRSMNGPMFLPPGHYKMTLNLSSLAPSGGNPGVSFQVAEDNGNILNQSSSIETSSTGETLSLSFYIYSMEQNLGIHLYVNNATVVVSNVSIEQQQQNSHSNQVVESAVVEWNYQNIPSSRSVLMELNISHFYTDINGNFSNLLFSLPNGKLVSAFAGGYNSSSKILSVYINHDFGSQTLTMLIMDKSFDSFAYGLPFMVAPWVHFNKGETYGGQDLFTYYSEFYNIPLPPEYILSTPQSNRGNYSIGDGLVEETNIGQNIEITDLQGFRPPYELTYVINMSYGNNVPPYEDSIWVSANSPEPVQLWLGNLSYIYTAYSSNGSQVVERYVRPSGINFFSFILQNSSFSFAINYKVVDTVYTGNVYENVTGGWPFTLFDSSGSTGVVSPKLLGLFLTEPEKISILNATLYEV